MTDTDWPDLAIPGFAETTETLHLWSQILGKIKVATVPWLNESWHATLAVSARGVTTGPIIRGAAAFELAFDLVADALVITTSDETGERIDLRACSVADFYADVMAALGRLGIDVTIEPLPCELSGAVPFDQDHAPRPFDPAAARAWWRALIRVQGVFHRFRSRFVGKNSPIHLFWGSFDLAVTRFSGRPAPLARRGGPNMSLAVAQDAYADEQASAGFWPGGGAVPGPAFYAEAWPVPPGFADAAIRPAAARFVAAMDEWVLDYAEVRASADPDQALLDFLQSTYDAIADGGGWDRAALERPEGPIGQPPLPAR